MKTETYHVIRVEDEDGSGPYGWSSNKSIAGLPWLFDPGGPLECECDKHPGPREDFDHAASSVLVDWLHYRSSLAFGFKDHNQFHRWFGHTEIEALKTYGSGFGVATYRAPSSVVIEGKHQVAFLKSEAERVSFTPLD